MMADTNATTGVDEARWGQSTDRVQEHRAVQHTFASSAPSAGTGVVDARQCFVSGRTNSTTRCSQSASTHDARCIARPHRAAVGWAVGNEWCP